jgi:hypothetical protein
MLTDTFAGISPEDVPAFLAFQVVGALGAIALAHFWRPDLPAADLVMPHEEQP